MASESLVFKNYIYLLHVFVWAHVVVGGQLGGVDSLLQIGSSGDQTQVVRLGGKRLYPPSSPRTFHTVKPPFHTVLPVGNSLMTLGL